VLGVGGLLLCVPDQASAGAPAAPASSVGR
jgi:hypothetical protein